MRPPEPPGEVWVTGAGVVSALGAGLQRHAEAVRCGESGLARHELFGGSAPDPVVCGLAPPGVLPEGIEQSAPHRANQLLGLALDEALASAGLEAAGLDAPLVAGTTLGNMHGGTLYYMQHRSGQRPDPALVRHFLPCAPLEHAARERGMRGRRFTVSSACGSATAALGRALRMVRGGRAARVVAGGFEALSPYAVAGFTSLQLVSARPCLPFDRRRDGLNPGEGAAMLVLESRAAAEARGARPLCVVAGFGESLEGYHQTRPHPDGAGLLRAMAGALEEAGLQPGDVAHLHLHGTATPQNDVSEARACRRLFGEGLAAIPACSTKAMTGHTLGASGALGAVFTLLALQDGLVPGTLGLEQPDPEVEGLDVSASPRVMAVPPACALTTALGFGGESFALALRRVSDDARGIQ